ncbi:MAG: porin [Candidatus Thiodiazotropha taylori]|nr:porin [Candidatus Thiodiazotropha taylori]MCG8067941.1 porin [Candidatus Thiodiazotropha taylori]
MNQATTQSVISFLVLGFALATCQASAWPTLQSRIQFGAIANDSPSENVFPSGFLNFDEGINLNRAELIIEKSPNANIKPRIGPFPGPAPVASDWGFEVDLRYGEDAAITYGLDDELHINDGKERLFLMPQWFLSGYLPLAEGFSWIAGSWFTSLGYEIGAPVDPPTGFYTHSYAFVYQPVKHVGVMGALKLPMAEERGLWSVGLGLVQGWNNLQDNNDDKTLLFDMRWRSADFRTWLDIENIMGYEQSEDGLTDQTRPFNAVSSDGEKLLRRMHSVLLSHRFNSVHRVALNAVYGYQEGGDLQTDSNNPPGFLITEDSRWYGANLNWYLQWRKDQQIGLRVEWFKDADGAHALLPAGIYRGVTANLSWWLREGLRIRPELRYDHYSGSGRPFGGRVPSTFFGEEKQQWVASLDVTWSFSL